MSCPRKTNLELINAQSRKEVIFVKENLVKPQAESLTLSTPKYVEGVSTRPIRRGEGHSCLSESLFLPRRLRLAHSERVALRSASFISIFQWHTDSFVRRRIHTHTHTPSRWPAAEALQRTFIARWSPSGCGTSFMGFCPFPTPLMTHKNGRRQVKPSPIISCLIWNVA